MAMSIKQVEELTGLKQRDNETEDSFRLRACAPNKQLEAYTSGPWDQAEINPEAWGTADAMAPSRADGVPLVEPSLTKAQAMLAVWREKYPEPLKAFAKHVGRTYERDCEVARVAALSETGDEYKGSIKRKIGMAPELGMGYGGDWKQADLEEVMTKTPEWTHGGWAGSWLSCAAARTAGVKHRIAQQLEQLGWTPRSTPVEANDGAVFWVVNEQGQVVLAFWHVRSDGGHFQNMNYYDEGTCGFTVTHYQPIIKPEAPKC